MKVSILGSSCLLVAASAAAVGASTTFDLDGNNRVLSGSDILLPAAKELLSHTPGHGTSQPDTSGNSADGTYYIGGGQSVGDSAIQGNTQQISVGTASLKSTNYCKNAATGTSLGSIGWINADGDTTTQGANPGPAAAAVGRELDIQPTTEALVIGLDGLSIYAHVNAQAITPATHALAVSGSKALIVQHYIPDPTKLRSFAQAAGDGVVAGTKTWTLASGQFSQRDVATHVTVSGSASNNGRFTIASVLTNRTFTTVETPVSETFAGGVTAAVESAIFVVDPTTAPTSAYGTVPAQAGDPANSVRYVFTDSLDVIRLLYGGLHHDGTGGIGTYDAGSDVRRSLADSYASLFKDEGTPTPAQFVGAKISHVWRRSDLAGATNAFVALVNFGARGIGALSGTSTKTNPFANSGDANGRNAVTGAVVQTQVNSTVKSNGGPGDFADFDPIRRPAIVGAHPVSGAAGTDLDQVSANDGTLGLVVTVFPPDTAGISATQAYPTRQCTGGAYALVNPGFTPTPQSGTNPCPQGGPYSSLCFIPYQRDTSTTPATKHFSCLSRSTNPVAFGAPVPADARVFNLVVRDDVDGHYIRDLNNRFLARSGFYRIHTTLSGVAIAGQPAKATQLTADFQAGALIRAEPLSVHFGGRGLDNNADFGPSIFATAASGPAPAYIPGTAVPPDDNHIKNLALKPYGAHVGADDHVYPLARRLYLNSLVGFRDRAGHTAPWDVVDPASGETVKVWGLAGQELAYARAWQNSAAVARVLQNAGLIPLPTAAEGYTPNGVSALDYPEDGAVTSPDLTSIPLNGCGAGPNHDSVALSGPDALQPYGGTNAAPAYPDPAAGAAWGAGTDAPWVLP
jgi:hypothetical protein